MSQSILLTRAESAVQQALGDYREAKARFELKRDVLHRAIAERDALLNAEVQDGYAMTCEHGHVACGIGSTDCTESQT